MDFRLRVVSYLAAAACASCAFAGAAQGQNFSYQAKPRAGSGDLSYSEPDPAPRMMLPSEAADQPPARGYLYPRTRNDDPIRGDDTPRRDYSARRAAYDTDAPPPRTRGSYSVLRKSNARPSANAPSGPRVEEVPPGVSVGPSLYPPTDRPTYPYDGTPQYRTGRPQYDNGPPPYADGAMPYTDGALHYGDGSYDYADGSPDSGDGYFDGDGPPCDDEDCDTCHHSPWTCMKAWCSNSPLFAHCLWENFSEFGGAQAFKGPVDQGVNGNFGFHKGVNWGVPLWDTIGLGYQLGGVIAVSDFEGGAGVVNHHREQYFVTTGLFHRANCFQGLQGGAVVDYLHDDFYVSMNLLQVRAEVSYLYRRHEIGVWAAVHTNHDTQTAPAFFNQSTVSWQSNDQYNLFYRYSFAGGGVGRRWIGLTEQADIIFGSDATVPLSQTWGIQAAYNYLLPRGDSSIPSSIRESWNLSMALVWYPEFKPPNGQFAPYRPLFSVADNGTLMITQK